MSPSIDVEVSLRGHYSGFVPRKSRQLPPASVIRDALRITEAGILYWNARAIRTPDDRRWNSNFADRPAGTNSQGYLRIELDGVRYLAHRLVWKMVTGDEPPRLIKHLDLDRLNNSWTNLAPALVTKFGPPPPATPALIIGDCSNVMATLTKQFNLIVTSPPYDAEKQYEGPRDLTTYRARATEWMAQIPRLLKPDGSFWLNLGYTKLGRNETLPLTYLYHEVKPSDLHLIQEIVWHYEGGMSYKKRFSHRTERWMWFALDPDRVFFDLDAVRDPAANRTTDNRNNPRGKNPTDYWYFDRVTGGNGQGPEKTAHPCQFPEPMIERIIRACCPEGGAILDPFAGSGTTGRVAARLGRHATLIERDPRYC
jgi:adenine-specific DNA-methyltransferase